MGNIYPAQTCTVSPYSEYNSNVVNRLTRMISEQRNCINSGYPTDIILDSTSPLTVVDITPGSVFKDDVFITIDEEFRVDFEDIDFYISGSAFNEAGYYYVLLEYVYVKSFPAPRVSIKIVKPSQHSLYTNAHILLKVVHVMFNGTSFEIDGLYDYDPSTPTNGRVHSRTRIGLENTLPDFNAERDEGRVIYVRDRANVYFGLDSDWACQGTFEYSCDTSGTSLGYMAYVGAGDIAYSAIATSKDTLATCIVTKIGSAYTGRVRFNGRVEGVLESGIDSTAGDVLYLSAIEPGRVTNVKPNIPNKVQPIGHYLEGSTGVFVTILSGLGIVTEDGIIQYADILPTWQSGDEGKVIYADDTDTFWFGTSLGWVRYALSTETIYHNSLAGLQGGDSTGFYHLSTEQFSNLGDGSHNGLASIQGGVSGERYHLSYSQYVGVGSTLPSTLMSLKSNILSLLSYDVDVRQIWNTDLNGENIGNTPVGDIVSNKNLIDNGSDGINKKRFGLLGLFASDSWTARSTMNDTRVQGATISLTSDLALVAGGYNHYSGILATTERYSNSLDTWTNRTDIVQARNGLGGATLTTNSGLVFGGENTGVYLGTTEKYSDSGNSWVTKTALTPERTFLSGSSLTSDMCLVTGAWNGSLFSNVDAYTDSGDTWISKTPQLVLKDAKSDISLTGEFCVSAGGSNSSPVPSTEKYCLSTNLWSSKTSLPFGFYDTISMGFNSDMGLLASGYNSTLLDVSFMYSDSRNTWESKSKVPIKVYVANGISFNCNTGLLAGGGNNITGAFDTSYKYSNADMLASLNGFLNISTVSASACPIHHASDTVTIETNRLINQNSPILSVISSLLYNRKKSTNVPTVDITLDDGSTWLTDQNIDEFINVSSLSPSGSDYLLRLKFNLAKDSSANIWTSKTAMTYGRFTHGTLGFDRNLSLVSGGQNADSAFMSSSELYSDTLNSWTAKTNYPDSECNLVGICVNNDEGILVGGSNSVNFFLSDTRKYNLADNAFYSLNSKPEYTNSFAGINLNYDSGLIFGGNNNGYSSSTFKLIQSYNLWQTKTSMVTHRHRHVGIQLTNYTGITHGGANTTLVVDTTDKFDDSSNVWSSRMPTQIVVFGHTGFGLTTDLIIIAGGINLSSIISSGTVNSYSDSGNIWIQRPESANLYGFYSSSVNQTNNLGLVSGGSNNNIVHVSLNYATQYCHGETSLIGFSSLYV